MNRNTLRLIKKLKSEGLMMDRFCGKIIFLYNQESGMWSKHTTELAAANRYLKNQFRNQEPFSDF